MSNPENCSGSHLVTTSLRLPMPVKIFLLLFLFLVSFIFLVSCGPSKSEMEYRERSTMIADSVSRYASGVATDTINGLTHNFARSGKIRIKVAKVLEVNEQIEDLVAKHGGYVAGSDLTSDIGRSEKIKFTADSLMESVIYTTACTMTIRIPSCELDTLLHAITRLALFIDHKQLKADDVKMELYANSLAEKRYQRFSETVNKNIHMVKSTMAHDLEAADQLLEKQTLSDETNLNSHYLADQVNYSKLNIELYQWEQVSNTRFRLPAVVTPYAAGFGENLKTSFLDGLEILKSCLLLLVRSWGLLVFLSIVFLFTKRSLNFFRRKFLGQK